ncbi:MAG: hypothetical protein BWK79_00455 [Beggiatoa sp. IS2]|nr:MAG: hypothetical protein BWK79_00455 [Beggiatoa sp. IS2]
MSTESGQVPVKSDNSLDLIRVLGVIAVISGLLIVLAYQLTLPAVIKNRQIATGEAILEVIRGTVSYKGFALSEDGLTPLDAGSSDSPGMRKMYAGYDAAGNLLGVALEAAGQGYSDTIIVLYSYSPACECINGIKVVQNRDTPGIGDKIQKNLDFLKNFEQLDAKLNADKSGLANAIHTVKHGTKKNPWEVDAISGATISSRAVGKMLNNSTAASLPLLVKQFDKLKEQK